MNAENKAVIERFYEEVWNKGDTAALRELVEAQYVLHDVASPRPITGYDGLTQFVRMYRVAFPDIHFTIDEMVAEGSKVVTRWTATGTHSGDLQGIAPTGRQMRVSGINLTHLTSGKLIESWVSRDMLDLFQQLGVTPAMQPAAVGVDSTTHPPMHS